MDGEKLYPVDAKYYAHSYPTLALVKVIFLTQGEYDKYLKKQFPIRSSENILYYLDENDFEHREGNLLAVEGFSKHYTYVGYHVHGKLHRTNGPAYYFKGKPDGEVCYSLDGVAYPKEVWEQKCLKKIIFSAQKIKTIKKLLYIPELFQNVYYERKSNFISLLQKI